jgi:chloramphenicol-sensitive protein RarD
MIDHKKESYTKGLIYAVFCYVLWGVFPIYWKLLKDVPAEQILAHRIIWSLLFLAGIILLIKNNAFLTYIKSSKIIAMLIVTSFLIAINWGVYIFAVNQGHIVEASLGYYINPIFSILLGVLFMKERLTRPQIIAVIFALAGVLWFTIHLGFVPWISLILASTFSLYGLLRKRINLESLPGLLIETIILSPLALWYLIHVDQQHTAAFMHQSALIDFLLIFGGPITAIPLFLFGMATTRIPLSMIGFIQYLSPTISLLIGLFLYKESFSTNYLISFCLVWIGLAFYLFSVYKGYRIKKRG